MKIYISGKITGTTDHMERFADKQKELELKGYEVINPALINSFLPKSTTWEEYMSMCYPLIDMCDIVYFLKDWKNSVGASMEYKYCVRHGKKCIFEKENAEISINGGF